MDTVSIIAVASPHQACQLDTSYKEGEMSHLSMLIWNISPMQLQSYLYRKTRITRMDFKPEFVAIKNNQRSGLGSKRAWPLRLQTNLMSRGIILVWRTDHSLKLRFEFWDLSFERNVFIVSISFYPASFQNSFSSKILDTFFLYSRKLQD